MERRKMIVLRAGSVFYHRPPGDLAATFQVATVLGTVMYRKHGLVFLFLLMQDGKIEIDSCTGREWELYTLLDGSSQ